MAIQLQGNSGTVAEVETNTRALRTVVRSNDYTSYGIYSIGMTTGNMAAGLASSSPIFSIRTSSVAVPYTLIKKITVSAAGSSVAFTAGPVLFNLYAARTFTAADSSGAAATLTGNNAKLRTSMATTALTDMRVALTGTLTAGTRTLDTQPLASVITSVSTTTLSATLVPIETPLFRAMAGDQPFIVYQSEGFVIQATVPATGLWYASINVVWEELSTY